MSKLTKTQSLEERFNEISAVAQASLAVEKLRELSKSPKLARTREQRAHEWIVLSRLAENQANALHDLNGPNPVLPVSKAFAMIEGSSHDTMLMREGANDASGS